MEANSSVAISNQKVEDERHKPKIPQVSLRKRIKKMTNNRKHSDATDEDLQRKFKIRKLRSKSQQSSDTDDQVQHVVYSWEEEDRFLQLQKNKAKQRSCTQLQQIVSGIGLILTEIRKQIEEMG